ncbi:OmpA family protein [Flavihumibacter rivuli]|uniref:OmpA family protein n=1 Tax=Flavihumibacter rivuli TaxID=2838156 RepID=UPI001BDED4F7|nr:OmpA family protein [Flavihumibacter rivuli]ULQ56407.1 OmpA family protein [Flavihumibacter rivuli]
MSFNILDAVKGFLTPDLVSQASSFLGESDSSVTKALGGLIPTVLGGITQKAESGGADAIFNLAKQAAGSGILGNLAGNFLSGGGGIPEGVPGMLQGIFGSKAGGIANLISSFAGIKGSSAASLLGMVAPLALGVLGKHSSDSGLNAGGLLSLLSGQKNSILNAIPSGLNLSGILGDWAGKATSAASAVHHEVEQQASSGGKWLWPVLLALAGVGLLLYLMKGCGGGEHKEAVTTEVPAVVVDSPKAEVVAPVKESLKVKLPNGVELDAYKGGIEDLLVTFLNDPNAKPGKDNWFDFNDLNFKFGTAEIIPESRKEVDNLVQILKAYPNAKIKIGGYTDKVGDEAANKKLSGERAQAVKAALEAAGVGSQIDGAEGYGSEFAKYPADAPEADRIKDRRVSVSVRAK